MSDKLEQMVAKHDAEIHAVNQRLGGIETTLTELKSFLQSRSQTNWSVIIAALGVSITILTLAFAPIVYGVLALREEVIKHESVLDERAMLLGEHNEKLKSLEREIYNEPSVKRQTY